MNMKGIFDLLPTIFAVVFFLFGVVLSIIGFISSMSVVTVELVKNNYEKLTVVDITHGVKNCLTAKGLDSSSAQNRLDACRQESGAEYLELLDINKDESGKIYRSGEKESRATSHTIYLPFNDGKEAHQARLSVYKKL